MAAIPTLELRDFEFQAFDTLWWVGRNWTSRAIQLATCTPQQWWYGETPSHVSVIAPWCCEPTNFESTTLCPLPCVIRGVPTSGVQAHRPHEEIAAYDGRVILLRLPEPLAHGKAIRLGQYLAEKCGAPYDYPQALAAGTHWIKRMRWARPNRDAFFCDELVSYAGRKIEVLEKVYNPAGVSPAWLFRWIVTNGIQEICGQFLPTDH
ncbi:MAG: hypothetical protein AB7U73_01985 [Pirellulales bacterium]